MHIYNLDYLWERLIYEWKHTFMYKFLALSLPPYISKQLTVVLHTHYMIGFPLHVDWMDDNALQLKSSIII